MNLQVAPLASIYELNTGLLLNCLDGLTDAEAQPDSLAGGQRSPASRSRRVEPRGVGRAQRAPVSSGDRTRLGMIAFLAQHDSYHLGQIAFIRRHWVSRRCPMPAIQYRQQLPSSEQEHPAHS
jgi:hypothetical protein